MKYITLLGLLLLICGCAFIDKYPHDNVAEEVVEEIIEYKTGLDIDLTPFSPED